tara:strand:- start:448 stop:1137 length:690 start_codon:yes stop_codon:yes gene_type:complete
MENYPETATERFDDANIHIKYCLSSIKKYIFGDILEVGAGCGSFTRNYIKPNTKSITLTELDPINLTNLREKYKNNKNVDITNLPVSQINKKFDCILYFHVLEHIKNDLDELKSAELKLKKNGYIIIMAPAHQKIYGNLDEAVGHFRRYEPEFFKKDLAGLNQKKIFFLDSMGYILYYLNKIFFRKETFPSKFKIFIWDKFFTPLSIILDFILCYRFGKCIVAIYKKIS